jgi:FtsP/CotA-like multicopper oxidase with cupredoxin domain
MNLLRRTGMRLIRPAGFSRSTVAAVAAGVVGLGLMATVPTASAETTTEGIECTTGATGTPSFDLTATTGYIYTPDGNSLFSWGYAGASGTYQLPGPTLCVNEGDTVSVVLHNALNVPTSLVFSGLENVMADGAPSTPEVTGTEITSLTKSAAAGGSVTYSFVADRPGTFLYSSGTDQRLQTQMGLYGALVVRPAAGANYVYDDQNSAAPSRFANSKEFVHILSELDPQIHLTVERGRTVNWANYRPRYFMINGRSMPDTLSPNHSPFLPGQPYGAMVHIEPYDATDNPDPAVIRYLNAGTVSYPFHPHGNSQRVIGRDGSHLAGGTGEDLSYDKYLINVGPGQTMDVLVNWTDVDLFNPDTNPYPVTLPQEANILDGANTYYSQSPYLGFQETPKPGVTLYNQCGEFYHVAHSHALQQSTNYGAAMGGMMTLIRIDPPQSMQTDLGLTCQ